MAWQAVSCLPHPWPTAKDEAARFAGRQVGGHYAVYHKDRKFGPPRSESPPTSAYSAVAEKARNDRNVAQTSRSPWPAQQDCRHCRDQSGPSKSNSEPAQLREHFEYLKVAKSFGLETDTVQRISLETGTVQRIAKELA
jgi:hypothetical protein